MRRLLQLAAAAVALSISTGLGVTAPSALGTERQGAETQATTVHRVSPLDAEGHLRSGYDVAATRKGHCWTTSMVNGHLYRCMQGNFIHDPCWKESGRHSVVCLTDPWAGDVVRLRLTKPLPETSADGPAVWGLERADGVGGHCIISSGAGGTVDGRPISYYCHKGWALVGRIDRSEPTWAIRTARQVGDHYEARGWRALGKAWEPVVHLG